MLRIKLIICFLTITVCMSCNDNQQNTVILTETKTQFDVTSSNTILDTLKKNFPPPIDIRKFKKSLKSFTSGVLPSADSKVFCNPENKKFFGFYYLLDNKGSGPY